MSEQINTAVLPAETPFITVSEARAKLLQLIGLAPNGGKRFGITTSYLCNSMLSTPDEQADKGWRIGITIEVPRYATMLFGQLASWGLPYSRKRIEFVVNAKADAFTHRTEGGQNRKAHGYTVLNGSFQSDSIEMKCAKPFRDSIVRRLYGIAFDHTDFDKVLDVVRSEITGQPAFPE